MLICAGLACIVVPSETVTCFIPSNEHRRYQPRHLLMRGDFIFDIPEKDAQTRRRSKEQTLRQKKKKKTDANWKADWEREQQDTENRNGDTSDSVFSKHFMENY